jgi:hypothetical protein
VSYEKKEKKQEVKKSKWKKVVKDALMSLAYFSVGLVLSFAMNKILGRVSESDNNRKKLRYFNPTIKKSFLGQYIEWTGREKPLTDKELNALL